jgi:DNA-binding response OmpR family regulator
MDRPRALAFNVDPDSVTSLHQAFPEWEVQVTNGVTPRSLRRDPTPLTADLLVVGAEALQAVTLGLCRGLRSQAGQAHTPLLVLVPPGQQALVRAALDASAHGCLVLPIHPKDLLSGIARARAENQPGRHTLGLDRPQSEDQWQDDGGEG